MLAHGARVRDRVESADRLVLRHRAAASVAEWRIEPELGGERARAIRDPAGEVFGDAAGAVAEQADALALDRPRLAMQERREREIQGPRVHVADVGGEGERGRDLLCERRIRLGLDRKSTRLNSSHLGISY